MTRTRNTPLTRKALEEFPLPPILDGGKETKGRLLVVAGSVALAGAALLVASAAMRSGAGKLRMVTVEGVAVGTALAVPEALVVGLTEARDGGFTKSAIRRIDEEARKVDAVVAGPGMADGRTCSALAEALLHGPAKLVLDAALLRRLKTPEPSARRKHFPILLPHAGELSSLLDCEEKEIEEDPIGCGVRAAQLYQAIVLVKGVTSHVVTPDGDAWTYRGGVPGLGVSGSGDTLAGIVGGLLARGADPLTGLLWGVLLHGEAGEKLAKKVGPIGFLAREIPDEIPSLLAR
jgi:ADP-dependent NAD(P)H-hydrate dehydratase